MTSFAGMVKGSFFEAPEWVDKNKPPGHTSLDPVYGKKGWWKNYLTTAYFFYSPNFVWFLIAFTVYVLFPYDFEAAKRWDVQWMVQRLLINTIITFCYFGFWDVVTYVLNITTRKFNQGNDGPQLSRLIHNIWYTFLGCVHATAWEVGFVHMYAAGSLPYVSNAQAMSSPVEILKFCLGILFVPAWRDLHFYFAHRLIHVRVLYKYVHSLHHRNTDIDTFSGLCMHPIEHLYYYSCMGPSLYMHASPFVMMWNMWHLLISPAASHSGWEDHFQSDQFHYLHHSKFECNYGTNGIPFDRIFGTFRDRIGKASTYKGQADEKDISAMTAEVQAKTTRKKETKATFLTGGVLKNPLPKTWDHAAYHIFTITLFFVSACAAMGLYGVDKWQFGTITPAQLHGFLLAFSPALFGYILMILLGDKKSPAWPFHKEPLVGAFGFHIVVAFVVVMLPVYHFMTTMLGSAPYCDIFSC